MCPHTQPQRYNYFIFEGQSYYWWDYDIFLNNIYLFSLKGHFIGTNNVDMNIIGFIAMNIL